MLLTFEKHFLVFKFCHLQCYVFYSCSLLLLLQRRNVHFMSPPRMVRCPVTPLETIPTVLCNAKAETTSCSLPCICTIAQVENGTSSISTPLILMPYTHCHGQTVQVNILYVELCVCAHVGLCLVN